MGCLDNIVGLDRNPCECFETGRPVDYNASTSGYYLTDPEYGVQFKSGLEANSDCSEGSVWDVLLNARTQALLDFEVDLKAAVSIDRKHTFRAWNGVINSVSSTRSSNPSRLYVGNVIKPIRRLRHQKLIIKSIYLGLEYTGDVDLILNSNKFGFTPIAYTITVVSGEWVKHELETPIELDLYQAETEDLYYTFSYAVNGSNVLQNKIHCGCGTRPAWSNTVNVFGYTSDEETSDFSNVNGSNTQANGLAFESYTYCDELAFVCDLDQLGGKNMKSLIGRAIQYKATVKILSKVLESGNINKYSLLDRNGGFAKMNHSQERYNELIKFIAQNLPTGFSGCFGCNSDSITIQPLMV